MAASLSPSGLPSVDARWGGLAPGGAYLLVGRAGSGRTALALQAAAATVDAGGRALLISPRAPEALVETGTEAGSDLRALHATGRLRLLRIPAAADLAARGADSLDTAYTDLIALVTSDRPDRVVVEDFTPLVQFDTFDRFRAALSRLIAALREAGVTLVVGLGEPANEASHHLIDVVHGLVDGTVTLETRDGAPHLALSHGDDAPPAEPAPLEPVAETAAAPPPVAEAPAIEAPVAEAPPIEAPPAEAPTPPTDETPAAEERTADGIPRTAIVAPPDADPALRTPIGDPFGQDPAASMFEQGYLVDSGASGIVGSIPSPAPGPVPAPEFAPLSGAPSAPADPDAAFRHALDTAFAARAAGTPFLVVAVRMDSIAPEGTHFFAVADGLRQGLRPQDRLLVNLPRRRAVVVLPGAGPDGASDLFARLQSHLRAVLGGEAEAVSRGVAAVSVPDGQPFASTQDLLAYAYES